MWTFLTLGNETKSAICGRMFDNTKVHELTIGQVHSADGPGHVTRFWCKYVVKGQGDTAT